MPPSPPVPAPFASALAGREEVKTPGAGATFHSCFGCGPGHDIGVRVRCFRGEREVLSPIIVLARFAGPSGAAHGGIVAAYLDEIHAGAALAHRGLIYVTGELSVRYVK